MKPFRTTEKDRAKFARALGYSAGKFFIDQHENRGPIMMEVSGRWSFVDDGFQQTVSRLIELGYTVVNHGNGCNISKLSHEINVHGEGQSAGERLFRAVVKLEGIK